LAVADVDGDGIEDVVLGGTEKEPAKLVLGTAAAFAAPRSIRVNSAVDDGPLVLFDADGNGSNDLLVTKSAGQLPELLLNDGRGGFTPAPPDALSLPAMVAGAVAAADFDRDGQLDVFVGARLLPDNYPLAPRSALLKNTGGRFEDVTDQVAGGLREIGLVTSAVWSDVDGDGWLDLLVALEWGGVRYWRNNAGQNFEDRSERAGFTAAGTGWWSSLSTADFNSDGLPDFVAGNVGLNTPYRATADRPALLFHGRFASGISTQIVEAYHEGDTVFPRRTRHELGAKIPSILKRFPRGDLYAEAPLSEIIDSERLAAAKRFAATELRSGVFLSQENGTYRFESLPRIAQISPLQGLAAGDFDGDGHADIVAAQNSYAPIASVGRFDGGLGQFLRGDGQGNFAAVPVAESNLVIPGDAKALVVLDFDRDGWPDLLVTRNNSTTLAFRNEGNVGRKALRVMLRGPLGNPTAIGARVTLQLADGTTQTAEVQAGSGYASQSSPACFFGYVESNAPRRVKVRWPTGEATEHDVPEASATILISAPTSR
jgi:hypothetical protein